MLIKAKMGTCQQLTWLLLIAMHFSLTQGENITRSNCDARGGFWCKGDSYCIHHQYICSGVAECPDGSDESLENCVFLAGQHGSNYGRVEVIYNGVKGTVCSKGWNRKDARVICRQLGLSTSFVQEVPGGLLGRGSGPIWMDQVQCNGSEKHLGLCQFAGYGKHRCNHSWDAGVLCQGTRVSLFLGGTHGTNFGRLQAMYYPNKTIGTVCDDGWDDDDAKVACRQLGHPTTHARAVHGAMFGEGTGPIFLSNVDCHGTESNILPCGGLNRLERNNCSHDEDAGVVCGYELDVRLDNNILRTLAAGELQVKYKSDWLTVRYTSYSGTKETSVICRQLGFPSQYGNKFRTPVYSDGPRLKYSQVMSNLVCDGSERNVGHCKFTIENITQMYDYGHDHDHIETTYIVCGDGTWNGNPTFINVSTENEMISVPVGQQAYFVCETSYPSPQTQIQWQTSTGVLNKASITTTTEIRQNMVYITTSRITFSVSYSDSGTLIRCKSENLLDKTTSYSKRGILEIRDIETTSDVIQLAEVSSPSSSTSPETVALSTFIATACTLGVVAAGLGIWLTFVIFQRYRRRSRGVDNNSPLQQSTPGTGSGNTYTPTTSKTAPCSTNPVEATYDVPPQCPRAVNTDTYDVPRSRAQPMYVNNIVTPTSYSDQTNEPMDLSSITRHKDRTVHSSAKSRKHRETVEMKPDGTFQPKVS